MSVARSVLRSIFQRIEASLGVSQIDIACWCGVTQPIVCKWKQWAEETDHSGHCHPPNEEHSKLLCGLYREAVCVYSGCIDPQLWLNRAQLKDGSYRPIWNTLVEHVCAHSDVYTQEDATTAMEDLADILRTPDPDEYKITIRRGRLRGAHARCFAVAGRGWIVIVDEGISGDRFEEEALREVQAHILRPQPHAEVLHVEAALNGKSAGEERDTASESGDTVSPSRREPYQSWVSARSKLFAEEKRAIASHVVTHILDRKTTVQIASGTTESALMDAIIANCIEDLQITTNNLQIMVKGRGVTNLGSMTITLTGGRLNESLASLIGPDAAQVIADEAFKPNAVFFGAAGLSFQDGLWISYAFQDELATQVAYATRPTVYRVLMADHTKLGNTCGRKAPVTIESMLDTATSCHVVSTFNEAASNVIEREVTGLRQLLEPLTNEDRYKSKDFLFRLVDLKGNVVREYSLGQLRMGRW